MKGTKKRKTRRAPDKRVLKDHQAGKEQSEDKSSALKPESKKAF